MEWAQVGVSTVTGSVEFFAEDAGQRRVLGRVGAGEFCGEVGFLSGLPPTFSVSALERSQLLALNPRSLASLRRFSPYLTATLLLNISRILFERLVNAIQREAKTREKKAEAG